MTVNERIAELKIMPVVVLHDAANAEPLAAALIKGGLPAAEVTFRTAAAEESIKRMAEAYPEMLVGAGTITSVEQAEKAVAAGAKFLVSAGFSRPVAEYAVKNDVPYFPGCCTPSELMWVLEFGLPVAKFFPAEAYGGLKTIKALAGPFPQLKFMPTGGISAANVKEYLADPHIIACGGSWMVKDALIKEGKFDEIEKLTAEAVALTK